MSFLTRSILTICLVPALFGVSAAVGAPAPLPPVQIPAGPEAGQGNRAGFRQPPNAPSVSAVSAILIDSLDGRVLWEKSPHRRQAVASTGKILTALVVLERARPGDVVRASSRAEAVGNGDSLVTQLNLAAGEKLTVEQLLYGLLLPSANDAAVALAEHVAGSMERFADMMNARARELGARDSHFTNANGLDQPGQYSSAHDLALFARAAMKLPLFRKIVADRSHAIPQAGRPGARALENRNQLLARYPAAIGIKTGQTLAAGKSLVGAARRAGEERIAVVLASPDPVAEAQEVLEYGLGAFRRFQMTRPSRSWGTITYGDGTSARLVALKGAGTLLSRTEPDPKVSYDHRRRLLTAAGGTLRAPVKVECLSRGCRLPPRRSPRVAPGLVSMLAPLLALAR